MRKLFVSEPGTIEMKEIELISKPGEGEIKIKVLMGGICGSDMSVYKGKIPYAEYPLTPGHEVIGEVIEAGANARFKVGDKVASYPNTYCGKCENCLRGMTNICVEKKSFGVTIDGLFAEEIIIDSEFAVGVPADIDEKKAVLMEPLSVCVHAIGKADLKNSQKIAVMGCGTEGMLCIAILSYLGMDITAIDINEDKLAIAKEFDKGITTLVPGQADGRNFDVVIEAAGAKKAIEQAFEIVKPGGKMITLGLTNEDISYPCFKVVRSEITIQGSIIYTKDDFDKALEYLKDEDFNIKPIISEVVPFEEFRTAYDHALSGKMVKVLMDFK
ncbi:L-iditol 2-dehydrogenase [Dethiosulfatibacter aminovorans DSM 17477]|uniref:L-iditol 2-dehydrogenase n=1 Tax=Dethiosulfatibacter aminovorans DSM 17477 TaxID=1121476 RepID=A0A1M6AJ31_9FIRM|nr:alcohol dehydrogenase catalytic domain-containing protein [Dethiosulfatibacter aminovorans]SHI36338.1 L-iditol 2-dehydrogenase [Dethiosulfatibacter aminovorans DSM 17477]